MTATLVLDPERFGENEVAVEGAGYRHLFRARRLAVADRLRVVDGAGAARWAEVREVDRRRAVVRLLEPAPAWEPAYSLELVVATPKRERASALVEKATEVGVTAVRFVSSERSPRDFGAGTFARLERVAAAAVEQCGRSRVPEVTGVHGWEEVPELLAGTADRWMAHTQGEDESRRAWDRRGERGVVLIGPEGGWSDAEVGELVESGCRRVWLGERVLRVETAALVAAAAVLLLNR